MTKFSDQLNLEKTENEVVHEPASEALSEKSVGQILRDARLAQGMDLGLLASSLKVSARQIELLEADRYDGLPDMAFTRNFAISVAKRLRVDDREIAALLPKVDSVSVASSVIKMSPDMKNAVLKNEVLTSRKRKSTWLWIFIGILAILLGLFFLLPQLGGSLQQEGGENTQGMVNGSASIQSSAPQRVQQMSVEPLHNAANNRSTVTPITLTASNVVAAGNVPSQDALSEQAQGEVRGTVQAGENVASIPAREPETNISDADASMSVVTEAVKERLFEIQSKSRSWVRVRSTSGKTLYENTLKTGEMVSLSVKTEDLPLTVRVGRANDVAVSVDGKTFDLSPHIVGDVADFKVK